VEHIVKTGVAEEKVHKRQASCDSNRNRRRTYLNCGDAESRLRDGGSEIVKEMGRARLRSMKMVVALRRSSRDREISQRLSNGREGIRPGMLRPLPRMFNKI
jgi:hypothetical protein